MKSRPPKTIRMFTSKLRDFEPKKCPYMPWKIFCK